MDEDTMGKIFDPFFTTKDNLGTGLGLSQVSGFIKRSEGYINVESKLNHGSSFELYFKRAILPSTDIIDKKEKSIYKYQGNETILVLDDEQALRKLIQNNLTQLGYKVICAKNGNQALELIKENTIDLVISDIVMPEMDGYKFSKLVNNLYPKIKILLISGYSKNIIPINLSNRVKILKKPFVIGVLLTEIRVLLD